MEQDTIWRTYRIDKDWRATENAQAIGSHIGIFNCPSTPDGLRFHDYTNAGFTVHAAVGDFSVENGINSSTNSQSTLWPLLDTATTVSRDGVMQNNKLCTFGDIPDGTSNTLVIVEDAGRPWDYRYPQGTRFNDVPKGASNGAGWAARENSFTLKGSLRTPTSGTPGPCPMNCFNGNEIYSFHPGGSNIVFADGSVHFIRDSIDIRVIGRLVTRAAGEVVGEY
jgi:prepilin-type processing-associated H-X9-DG protein